jgi:hypothetical protein
MATNDFHSVAAVLAPEFVGVQRNGREISFVRTYPHETTLSNPLGNQNDA